MNREDLKISINNIINDAIEDKDYMATWFVDLGIDKGIRYAVVVAWMDYDNDTKYDLYMKIGCQPTQSIMQCDYDIDWEMPTINGSVYDTEVRIPSGGVIDWILDEWDVLKRYLDIK